MYKIQQDRKQRKRYPYDPQLEQRYFRRNEGSTDYATIPEVTLAGDFVIEFDAVVNDTSANIIVGRTLDSSSTVFILNGSVHVRDSAGVTVNAAGIIISKLNSVRITNISGEVSIAINGSSVIAGNVSSGFVFDRLYTYASGFNLSGILANLKIYDNGTLVRDYPINDGKNILANVATALGSEIDGLTYALTTAIGGVASVVLSSLSVIGKTYLVEVSYSGVVGDASVRIGGFSGPSFTGTGTIEFVATATTAVNDILGALTGVTSGSVTVSIKEAEGYGTIINGNASDWGLFDKQADGDWLGQELVVNGGFDTDSDWTLSGTSIAGGKLVFGTDTTYADQVNLITGNLYQFRFDVVDYNGASIGLSSLTVNPSYLVSAVGSYMIEDNTVNNYVRLVSTGSDLNAIDNISVKEVLKNA